MEDVFSQCDAGRSEDRDAIFLSWYEKESSRHLNRCSTISHKFSYFRSSSDLFQKTERTKMPGGGGGSPKASTLSGLDDPAKSFLPGTAQR
jgi:hypothetical protein